MTFEALIVSLLAILAFLLFLLVPDIEQWIGKQLYEYTLRLMEAVPSNGWICTNCGAEYGDPPYLFHSSWGCSNCAPHMYPRKEETQ